MLLVSLFVVSCTENNDIKYNSSVDTNPNEVTFDEFKKELIESTKKPNFNPTINPDRFRDFINNNLRSCTASCDYDVEDCSGLINCDTDTLTGSFPASGCYIDYVVVIKYCFDIYGTPYFQVNLDTLLLQYPCSTSGPNYAFNVNYSGNTPSNKDTYFDLITGIFLTNVIDSYIYNNMINSWNSSGFGNIVTVINKNCYAYCNDNDLYLDCGDGCCVRMTYYYAEEGNVSDFWTENVENGGIGHCLTSNNPDCTDLDECVDAFDCNIWTGD